MISPKDYSPWVPFDLYDFFGYLFPGAFLLFTTCLFFQFSGLVNFIDVINATIKVYEKAPFIVGLIMVVMGIILVYTLGHFVAMFGQIIFDRIFLDEIIQHPIFALLKIEKSQRIYSVAIFQIIFFLYNLFIVFQIFNLHFLRVPLIYNLATSDIVIIFSFLLLFAIKIIVMICRFNPECKERLERNGLPMGTKFAGWLALFISNNLIKPLISSIQKLLGLDRPFSDQLIEKHKENFKKYFGLDSDEAKYENYWLSFFYTSSRNLSATAQIKNWLQLYSFARNTSAAAYLTLTIMSIVLLFSSSYHNDTIRLLGIILYLFAIILMLRYWYLYYNYFVKNIIRAFIEGTSKGESSSDK
jgi:hypothetical protein